MAVVVKTVLGSHFGVDAPPILEPILVVGLGCSLGANRDFDPYMDCSCRRHGLLGGAVPLRAGLHHPRERRECAAPGAAAGAAEDAAPPRASLPRLGDRPGR